MTSFIQNLRSQVLRSSAEGVGHLIFFVDYLCEPEISQTDVAIFVHKNIFRFKVSVDDALLMQVTDSNSNLSTIKLGSLLVKSGNISEVHEELSSSDESHDEEDLLVGLENILHSNKERVISLKQNILLKFRAFDLIIIYNHILSKTFHGIVVTIVFLFHQEYLTERASSDNFDKVETLQIYLGVSFLCVESS